MYKSAALKRYNRSVLALSVVYAGALIGVIALFKAHQPTGVLAYVLAVLPALPLVGIFAAWGRYLVEEQDEYIRMLTMRQTLIATGFMLSVATIWGFLESFDLVAHAPMYWAAILWFGGLGLGACVNGFSIKRGAA